MRNEIAFNKNINKKNNPDEALKYTTLLYLGEALDNERYEECPDLIRSAKRFGATSSQVRKTIARHLKKIKGRNINKARNKSPGQRRF